LVGLVSATECFEFVNKNSKVWRFY